MSAVLEPALHAPFRDLAVPGIEIGHRVIAPDDAIALTAVEATSIRSQVPATRRASGAARIVARQLMAQMGCVPSALPKGPSGAPVWPAGIVGSLAHDDCIAVAAIARRSEFATLGIDVEPAGPLPAELLDIVTTARERLLVGRDPEAGRLLFAAKEAVYKAINPLDGTFLEFHDINVDLAGNLATLRDGRVLRLALASSTHVIALAFP